MHNFLSCWLQWYLKSSASGHAQLGWGKLFWFYNYKVTELECFNNKTSRLSGTENSSSLFGSIMVSMPDIWSLVVQIHWEYARKYGLLIGENIFMYRVSETARC
jgi:hypothetical protein